jgi:hypothetical protein
MLGVFLSLEEYCHVYVVSIDGVRIGYLIW